MSDEIAAAPADDTTVNTTVAIVVPEPEPEETLDDVRAQLAALRAMLDAHMRAHAEIADDDIAEELDDDSGTDDTGADDQPERERAEETREETARPIRRGLGGFLFGPIRSRKQD